MNILNHEIIIEALEHYYENEVFMEYDRSKGGVEYSFEMLRKSIQAQQNIIEIKKRVGIPTEENERELEKIIGYWKDDVENPDEILEKIKEEVEYELEWIPKEIENDKKRGWLEEAEALEKRYKEAKEKYESVKEYTENDIEKITGPTPFE